MKIIIVNKYATVTGGADRHALDLAALLTERGHDVRFLAFRPKGDLPFPGRYIRPTVTSETRNSIDRLEALGVATTLLWNASVADAMRHLIDDCQPDIVHIHKIYPQLSVAPALVAAHRGVPLVQTAHDYEFISASPADDAGHRIDRSSPRFVDRLVNTVGYQLRQRLHVPRVSRWIVPSAFVQRVYGDNGINADVLPNFVTSPILRDTPRFSSRSGVAFVGRLDGRKGLDDVIELARMQPSLTVTIAGMGELAGKAQHAAATMKNVNFEGELSPNAVCAVLERARVALMPALWSEPAPLLSLEAMLAATPIVAYARGGLVDHIELNGGGMLVRPGDVSQLSETTRLIHEDQEVWSKLSEARRTGVSRNHDSAVYVERLEAIYERTVLAEQ